jgi:hypothetical protein
VSLLIADWQAAAQQCRVGLLGFAVALETIRMGLGMVQDGIICGIAIASWSYQTHSEKYILSCAPGDDRTITTDSHCNY